MQVSVNPLFSGMPKVIFLVALQDSPVCRVNLLIYRTGWWFQIIVYFHPYLGKISILANICQRGWFNHQLNKDVNHMAAMRVSHSPSLGILRAFGGELCHELRCVGFFWGKF